MSEVSPPADPELLREVDRVADRVRVVVPRMASRGSAQAAALLADVRAVLQLLADLAADAEGLPRRTVPELAPHAWADQVLVLGRDVAARCPEPVLEQAQEALVGLRRRL